MSNSQSPITTAQVREMLLARGQQAVRIRRGLIGLLVEHTQLSDLAEMTIGDLVGNSLELEVLLGSIGAVIQTVIAPTPIEEPETHKTARRIMGNNFLGMPEVARAFGRLSSEIQTALAIIPFDEATLRSCCETHVLVADTGFSIIGVCGCVGCELLSGPKKDAWYKSEEFARRTEGAGWRLIQKTSFENSKNKNWAEQTALLGENDEVPIARRVVYATVLVFVTTGERLFEHFYVRTNDVSSDGRRIIVGCSGRGTLYIYYWNDDRGRSAFLGVAASRKS